ncbi:OmpA family protein [Rhodobacter sp. Har01]|uniref:OmpA family protein n=1 Tax=Rhodobacter sp. Har01 TaxID=2883999 RepID=UPI001D0617FD|nr:OmpA family protein [Rhodobacter sp. Har01]MCB6179524.1 OmpA family protein [Rhodobacter sp. Har01]
MTSPRRPAVALIAALLALAPTAGQAFEPAMPAPVDALESEVETHGSYDLPTGPFAAGALPTRRFEGAVDRRAYRLEAPRATLLDLKAPLRDQLVAAGFDILFECEARTCGGFDFRFATEVVPEPAMHVDLGEFLFLSAARGDEAVSLLVSRSAGAAFVQVIQVGPVQPGAEVDAAAADATAPDQTPSLPERPPAPIVDAAAGPASSAAAVRLDAGLPVALDDLVFASGAAELEPGDYPSLGALADWLAAAPARRLILVGHTDASGSLAANVALSKRRAEAVRRALINDLGVAPGQVSAEGVGPLAPRDSNQTEEGRRKNRRVEAVPAST